MANLQIAEVLYGAKVFVLHFADEVTFKTRALLAMDRDGSRGQPEIVDEFEDELPTAVQAEPPAELETWDDLVPRVDAEAATLPELRPTPVELAHLLARSMFTPETGLTVTDDSSDR